MLWRERFLVETHSCTWDCRGYIPMLVFYLTLQTYYTKALEVWGKSDWFYCYFKANEQIHQENFGKNLPALCFKHARMVAWCWHTHLFPPGPASVIIALTDGELQEHQLITAQQEVAAPRSIASAAAFWASALRYSSCNRPIPCFFPTGREGQISGSHCVLRWCQRL